MSHCDSSSWVIISNETQNESLTSAKHPLLSQVGGKEHKSKTTTCVRTATASASNMQRGSACQTQHRDHARHICEITNPPVVPDRRDVGNWGRTSCLQKSVQTSSLSHMPFLSLSECCPSQKAVFYCPVWFWNSVSCFILVQKNKLCSLKEPNHAGNQTSKLRHRTVSQCMK